MLGEHRVTNDALTAMRQRIDERDKILVTRAEIAAKDAQIAELTAANTTLHGEKEELAEQVETLTGEKAALQAQVEELTARVAELEAEAGGGGGEGGGETGGDEPPPEE